MTLPAPGCVLVVLDGWGLAPPGPGNGGEHSSIDALRAVTEMALGDVVVHAFTDGRDTSPTGGWHFLQEVESWGTCRVGSVMGRYFAMDRDHREERTQKAIDALVWG